MRRRHSTSRWRGLTLIELLAVIAGLAVLLGVLLPIMNTASIEAHRTGCQSNLYRIGLAFTSHMQDNDGRLPLARPLDEPVPCRLPEPPLTVALLGHFRPTVDIFICPGDGELYTHCQMSYWYNESVSHKRMSELVDRSRGIVGPTMVPMIWDADATVFDVPGGQLRVPRFHLLRQTIFGDLHVDGLSDQHTPMHPLR